MLRTTETFGASLAVPPSISSASACQQVNFVQWSAHLLENLQSARVSAWACRYERFSGAQRLQGSALVQRHAALPEDLANKAGRGLLVRPFKICCYANKVAEHCNAHVWSPEVGSAGSSTFWHKTFLFLNSFVWCAQVHKKDLDNAAILGQTQPESAKYL